MHTFASKGKSKHKRRFIGYTCPSCHKKVTDEDINRKKGKGPKPKDQRRKRNKKETVKEFSKVQPPNVHIEEIDWKIKDQNYTSPWESRNPRPRVEYEGWKPMRAAQPIDRSLEEVLIGSRNIRISAPLPYQKYRNDEKLKNSEVLKVDMEKLEQHEKKLVLIIMRLDRIEERMDKNVKELDLRLIELDSKLQAFSTLTSHMETIMGEARKNQRRLRVMK